MSEPKWYRARVKSWSNPAKNINKERPRCKTCNVVMSATPSGFVCFYCRYEEQEY